MRNRFAKTCQVLMRANFMDRVTSSLLSLFCFSHENISQFDKNIKIHHNLIRKKQMFFENIS